MTYDQYQLIKREMLASMTTIQGMIERERRYGCTKYAWEQSMREHQESLDALTELFNREHANV